MCWDNTYARRVRQTQCSKQTTAFSSGIQKWAWAGDVAPSTLADVLLATAWLARRRRRSRSSSIRASRMMPMAMPAAAPPDTELVDALAVWATAVRYGYYQHEVLMHTQ